MRFGRVGTVLSVAGAATVALGLGTPASAAAAIAVYPTAGTLSASPRSQISFRGLPLPAAVTVTGSVTGAHGGHLAMHSDGKGESFIPNTAFAPGEQVSVQADQPLVGQQAGKVTFTIFVAPSGGAPPQVITDPGGTPKQTLRFHTRRGLHPPGIQVLRRRAGLARGLVFVGVKNGPGQDGPMILDSRGRLVFFKPTPTNTAALDFRAQTYLGKPVLTWWQGRIFFPGLGDGVGVIYDNTYRKIAQVQMAGGYRTDLHEFQITPQNTTFLLSYVPVAADLTKVGGPATGGFTLDSIIQEIDIRTGLVEWEWHSYGNVPLEDGDARYNPMRKLPVDAIHVNSVEPQPNGDVLISGRNTNAVYLADRATGHLLWTLGGHRSDFAMGPGTRFVGQHDAHRLPNGDITVYDNGSGLFITRRPSQGLVIHVDMAAKTATLVRRYRHPTHLWVDSQGNFQHLPSNGFFTGWGGSSPLFTEFGAGGKVLFDARFTVHSDDTYRAYRLPWSGQPAKPPDVAAKRRGGVTRVWASWNGATTVSRWRVLGGNGPGSLVGLRTVRKAGFETEIDLSGTPRFVAVQALGPAGHVLGTSKAVQP